MKTVIKLCEAYGGFLEDFEKVLTIEDKMFPGLVAKVKSRVEAEAKVKKTKPTIH